MLYLGYYDIDVGLSKDDLFQGMRILALQDMNNDNLIDLVTINTAANAATVYYFKDNSYSMSTEFQIIGNG